MTLAQGNSELEARERLVASFPERCRAAGLADTQQRRIIYRCLAESFDHPTAEAVHQRVRQLLDRVSLATVYRNLRLFADAGLIDEVDLGGTHARYDANPSRHHHLICRSCGAIADHYSERFDELAGAGETIEGFEVHEARVNVFGLCEACRREQGGRSASTQTSTL